jgi:hypothetical protein
MPIGTPDNLPKDIHNLGRHSSPHLVAEREAVPPGQRSRGFDADGTMQRIGRFQQPSPAANAQAMAMVYKHQKSHQRQHCDSIALDELVSNI